MQRWFWRLWHILFHESPRGHRCRGVQEVTVHKSTKQNAIYVDDLYDDNVALRAENERLRAALTEIMQGARSVDYAIHVARVALGNDSGA